MPSYFAIPPDFSYKRHNRGGYAAVNGIRLHYERYGHGEPLLLLHGNAQAVDFWCLQIPALSQYFDVIAVDTRGHGQSGSDERPYSFELFAADMDALLEHLAIPSAHVVGWSDGANIGLVMALHHPHRVKKLVAMAANIFMDETVVGKETLAETRRMLASVQDDPSPESQHIARLAHLLLHHPQYRFEDLQRIACPVLVMAGETDVIKREHTEAIAAHIPQSSLWIAQGETHHYPVRNPHGFNQTVIAFLKNA
jgi:pimeloyl-ACP methyl ester carboxylesterase